MSIRLSVASYNIHGCRGLDFRTDPDRVVRVIREFDTDIVALQEVDTQLGKVEDLRQLNYLARETGLEGIPGPVLMRADSPCGTALLTRRRVLDIHFYDLSLHGREPRGALDVELEVEGLTVRLLSTHLGLRVWERRVQVAGLLKALSEREDDLVMLTGDMNEWMPFRQTLQPLHEYFGEALAPRTFPSLLPILALDRFWVKQGPGVIETEITTHKSALARVASDHLPLIARVTIHSDAAVGGVRIV